MSTTDTSEKGLETLASLNGFPSNQIPEKFRQDPYRFLIETIQRVMRFGKQLSGA